MLHVMDATDQIMYVEWYEVEILKEYRMLPETKPQFHRFTDSSKDDGICYLE